MAQSKSSPFSGEEIALIKSVAELQVNATLLADAVKRLEDAQEGTVERKGMKERIALAEENIKLHKEAWIKNEKTLKDMEERINRALVQQTTEISRKLEGQQTFITRFQPYLNIAAWLVALVGGWIVIQLISGQIRIVSIP